MEWSHPLRAKINWRFLKPWQNALRPLLEYVDSHELTVGTMRDRLDCIRVHMEGVDARITKQVQTRREYLVRLREALELIGLALHYDTLAWSDFLHPLTWDRARSEDGFHYDASQLQPLFQIVLRDMSYWDMNACDSASDYSCVHELFTEISDDALSNAYKEAKVHLQVLVGSAFDEEYRIPISLEIKPKRYQRDDHIQWCKTTRSLLWTLTSRSSTGAGSAFQLVSTGLHLWVYPLEAWLSDLLIEIQLANVVLVDLSLPLTKSTSVTKGIALNMAMGVGQLHGNAGRRSVVHTQSLQTLRVDGRFPQHESSRATCWRWLGYALCGPSSTCSVRYLQLEDVSLTFHDVEMFRGTSSSGIHRDSASGFEPPYQKDSNHVVRTVQLHARTKLRLHDRMLPTLNLLRFTESDSFHVLDENGDDEGDDAMVVMLPGFGPSPVKCENIVNASALPVQEPSVTHLESVSLLLRGVQPLALQRFMTCFGSSLRRLEIIGLKRLKIAAAEITAILMGCPKLEYLDLQCVHFKTMDAIAIAYENGDCQIRVLSLRDCIVSPASMRRFATKLADPHLQISHYLREFRFMCEVADLATGACAKIIDDDAAHAFEIAARESSCSRLEILELGLVYDVFIEYGASLQSLDREHVNQCWMDTKVAFLSIQLRLFKRNSTRKRKTCTNAFQFPADHRQRLVISYWHSLNRLPPVQSISSESHAPHPLIQTTHFNWSG